VIGPTFRAEDGQSAARQEHLRASCRSANATYCTSRRRGFHYFHFPSESRNPMFHRQSHGPHITRALYGILCITLLYPVTSHFTAAAGIRAAKTLNQPKSRGTLLNSSNPVPLRTAVRRSPVTRPRKSAHAGRLVPTPLCIVRAIERQHARNLARVRNQRERTRMKILNCLYYKEL